jgi:hypothetical protein
LPRPRARTANPVGSKPLLGATVPASWEVISSGSGGAVSNFTNPVNLRGNLTTYGTVSMQQTLQLAGNWEMRYLNETGSYTLSNTDPLAALNCSAGCTRAAAVAASIPPPQNQDQNSGAIWRDGRHLPLRFAPRPRPGQRPM